LCLDHVDRPHAPWKMNSHLLTENKFCEYLKDQISLYFEINDNPDTTPSFLWEAFKAYIRGCIISFEASRRKVNKTKLKELEDQIKSLDIENAHSPSIILHRQIATLKYEYNKIVSAKLSKAFLYTRQKYFEFGDKPHKLLARQLRKMENDRMIHKVKGHNNTILTKPKDINDFS